MLSLNQYKTVFFDCDGVILQSNHIKTKVFREVLESEDKNIVDKFIAYHKKNGGISRYKKFEHFYKFIKKDRDFKNKSTVALEKYSSLVYNCLLSIDYVPGFTNLLNFLNEEKISCYVISGGDQQELHKVFKIRGIYSKFVQILGSPISKFKNAEVLSKAMLIKKPALLFGDSLVDMKIAYKYGMDFCFINQFSEWKLGKLMVRKLNYKSIDNFNDPLLSFNKLNYI